MQFFQFWSAWTAPGFESRLGQFMLRTGSNNRDNLLILFARPAYFASGEIWDLDGPSFATEQYRIDALDAQGNIVETILSPAKGGGGPDPLEFDGKPYVWSFDRSAADIAAIRLDFVGTKNNGAGVAFDNIEAQMAPVPEPASVCLFGSGVLLILVGRSQRRLRARSARNQNLTTQS